MTRAAETITGRIVCGLEFGEGEGEEGADGGEEIEGGGSCEDDADGVACEGLVLEECLAACSARGYGFGDFVAVGVARCYGYGDEFCLRIGGVGVEAGGAFGACT